jgi:hypothetical protein
LSGGSVFWDITPCSPLKVDRYFGGISRLHVQDWRQSKARTSAKHNTASRAIGFIMYTRIFISPSEILPLCVNSCQGKRHIMCVIFLYCIPSSQ